MRSEVRIPNPEGSSLDLNEYIPYYVRAISNKLARSASVSFNRDFGVGLGEWVCIALLAMEGGVSVTRVAEVSGFDKAAISRSLASLEKKALVVSRPAKNHNRKKSVELTALGREVHTRVAKAAVVREIRLLEGMSAAERALLLRLLQVLDANAAGLLDPDDRARQAGA